MPRRNRNKGKGRARKSTKIRSARPKMGGAPVAVSEDIQQYTVFMPARTGQRGIRMKACLPITTLQRASSNATIGYGLIEPGLVQSSALALNLTEPRAFSAPATLNNVEYVSPVFDLIASAFTRYKINSLKFHYEPQASATTTERMVFGFAPDPINPIVNSTAPTINTVLALADSVAFAPWRSWSMDVSNHYDDTLYYTFSDPAISSVSAFTERFSDFGSITCITSSFNTTAATAGVLYMEIDLELVEFCPIVTTSPSSKRLAMKILSQHEEEERKKQDFKKMLESHKDSDQRPCSCTDFSVNPDKCGPR